MWGVQSTWSVGGVIRIVGTGELKGRLRQIKQSSASAKSREVKSVANKGNLTGGVKKRWGEKKGDMARCDKVTGRHRGVPATQLSGKSLASDLVRMGVKFTKHLSAGQKGVHLGPAE